MFEDFRKQAEEADFDEEVENPEINPEPGPGEGRFLGMSPSQRFVVSLMLLFMIIVVGVLFLVVTSRIVPPFMS